MIREEAVSTDRMWAGLARTEAGMVSGWHHHGVYESTIYVLSGALRMEFGPGGTEVLDAGPGDFLYVAPGAIHRESNPSDEDRDRGADRDRASRSSTWTGLSSTAQGPLNTRLNLFARTGAAHAAKAVGRGALASGPSM
jgi:redox-sensitive bicupin YhaK (pirin superfamily)